MPLTYRIDHDRRLITVTPRGALLLADMIEYQREVWTRPDLVGYDELIDMNEVAEIEANLPDRMRQLAALSAAMDPVTGPSRMAIVAVQDYHYGLGRMYKALREDSLKSTKAIGIFRTYEAATQWLGGARQESR